MNSNSDDTDLKSLENSVQPYNEPSDEISIKPEEEHGLMRTITDFTEIAVVSGEAAEREYLREREKIDEEYGLKDRKENHEPSIPPPQPRFKFWGKENASMRRILLKKYIIIIISFWLFVLGVWSIYWGSMYKRDTRLVNLSILINVENDLDLPISKALIEATQNNDIMPISAHWVIKQNLTETQVIKSVHNQDYWGAIYISDMNASQNLIDAFQNGQNINTTNFVKSYYETGKDPNAMEAIIEPTLFLFESFFQKALTSSIYPNLISNLTNDQFFNLKDTNALTSYPIILYTDGIPIDPVTGGPLQVGLIFMIIITFFHVMWTGEMNGLVAKSTVTKDYIIFRMIASPVTFLLVSLAFACLNRAFQIDMNVTWQGGFGVFWMISFLTMYAVGGANENISLILFAIHPPLMGFWLLFFVIINISATFAPIQLCPQVFRYAYAIPIKNAYELIKITLFNTSHKDIGRCFGVLAAWLVLNNLLFPLCIIFFSTRMKKKIIKEQKMKLLKK